MSEQRDYRDTVFLPKTDFPMKAGLPQKEPGILARWEAEGLYEQVRASRAGREKFILHDGPPYANGDMHIGHALNHVLKDMVVRTQTLLGKDAPYVPGWDCHGLPIEWKVEEQYRKKKLDKDQVPVEEFRAECRAYAQHWVDVQRGQLKRLGIGGDWDNPYLTMHFEAEATIVRELLKFAESGQLYRGAKPVMWSPVEKTALAEAEVEYEDIVSTQIDVAFEIVESPIPELVGAHAVIWTTTPWTIPVNQALAYGPEVEYYHVGREGSSRTILVARELLQATIARVRGAFDPTVDDDGGTTTEWNVLAVIKGSDLAGTVARHPMHLLGGFYAEPRPFLPGEFVTTESGTGLVHMAPDHGEDDFELCKAHGIGPKFVVEGDGRYREDWAWLPRGDERSMSVINPKFNAPDGPVCADLRAAGGLLAASADYRHSYPHSWRSKAKVIFRCTPQWFVPMDKADSRAPRQPAGAALGERGRRAGAAQDAAPAGDGRARRDQVLPREGAQPDRLDGRGAARLGAQPPACVGRADHAVRAPQDRRVPGRPRGQRADRQRGEREGRRCVVGRQRAGVARQRLRRGRLRADRRHPRRVVRFGIDPCVRARDRGAGPTCSGRPTSTSRAPTSIAGGSSRRCSNHAARAGGRRTRRC